ncbi:hypothetical protein O181_001356 [Austropuccinia psidii MF-1]|uniref:Uncharacterized protein n=1 Tax=Austropuccinia psidii MF-1 TaxID=1389203 RepID=A0A9Q3BA46_9BASI|nr:hypothetical protein [Austropuccinia psidii MF-1]
MGRIGRTTQRIYLKKMNWLGFMEEMKGWNPKPNFRLLEKKETRIRDSQAVIQAIENYWNMKSIVRHRDPKARRRKFHLPQNSPEVPGLTNQSPVHPGLRRNLSSRGAEDKGTKGETRLLSTRGRNKKTPLKIKLWTCSRGAQKKNKVLPKNIITGSESIDPELMTE